MNNRTRGGLGIDDGIPEKSSTDFTEFKPRSQPPQSSPEPAGHTAQETGFTTRHAPPPSTKIDGRSLRTTKRKSQLNIAVAEETKERFWTLAQAAGVQTGEEFLIRLMDGFIGNKKSEHI